MSDIKTLEIPKWGLSMQEGTISQWTIKEGESFKKGQELCVIETTKIANSLEAPFDGTLRRILAQKGTTLTVGAVIAICADSNISDEAIDTYIQTLHLTPTTEVSKENSSQPSLLNTEQSPSSTSINTEIKTTSSNTDTQNFSIPASLQGYQELENIFITPHALDMAKKYNVNLSQIKGSGPQQRISIKDIQKAVLSADGQWPDIQNPTLKKTLKSTLDDSEVPATPLARRMAKNWRINLHDCRASGSRGRVCKEDVEVVYYREHASSTQPSTPTSITNEAKITAIPMDGMRKTIAARLQAAKSETPHFYLTLDVDVEELQKLRNDINQTLPGIKLSINDMFIKAIASALMAVPEVNVQYDAQNQHILQFDQADISVAVAIPNGLITPIVKAANKKTLSEISTTMRDLATRAKTGKLSPDEFQGGSFCISNLGMFGIKQFEAIINPPQGAILALGTSEKRAVVHDDIIVIRQMVTLSLSCDHRVIDGATGAKFLASLKKFVEHPALFLV